MSLGLLVPHVLKPPKDPKPEWQPWDKGLSSFLCLAISNDVHRKM